MDFLNELFGSEMGELKRHQKVRTRFQPRGEEHIFYDKHLLLLFLDVANPQMYLYRVRRRSRSFALARSSPS